jgi:hypothetical protein
LSKPLKQVNSYAMIDTLPKGLKDNGEGIFR